MKRLVPVMIAALAMLLLTTGPALAQTLPQVASCSDSLFAYNKSGSEPYPMLSVNVWATGTLPAGCSKTFSLNSYSNQGATWLTSGTQALFAHDSITINADHTSGTLTVAQPPCFGQTDFYSGSTKFDGNDGALPHYPDSSTPQPLIAWSNGGSACATPSPSPVVTASPSPVVTASPSPVVTASPSPVITPSPSPTGAATPSMTPVVTPSPTATHGVQPPTLVNPADGGNSTPILLLALALMASGFVVAAPALRRRISGTR